MALQQQIQANQNMMAAQQQGQVSAAEPPAQIADVEVGGAIQAPESGQLPPSSPAQGEG